MVKEITKKDLESLKKEFSKKLNVLKSEQDIIVKKFLTRIRENKIKDLKSSL